MLVNCTLCSKQFNNNTAVKLDAFLEHWFHGHNSSRLHSTCPVNGCRSLTPSTLEKVIQHVITIHTSVGILPRDQIMELIHKYELVICAFCPKSTEFNNVTEADFISFLNHWFHTHKDRPKLPFTCPVENCHTREYVYTRLEHLLQHIAMVHFSTIGRLSETKLIELSRQYSPFAQAIRAQPSPPPPLPLIPIKNDQFYIFPCNTIVKGKFLLSHKQSCSKCTKNHGLDVVTYALALGPINPTTQE